MKGFRKKYLTIVILGTLVASASLSFAEPSQSIAKPLNFQPASVHGISSPVSDPKDQHDSDLESFTVDVRAVYAVGLLPEGEKREVTELDIDSRLVDIQEKLIKFPFRSFRLISEESDTLNLRVKDTLRLSNGQLLCLRAVEATADAVTVWLRWRDKDKSTLLDTRMNFPRRETMVAGVESKEENSGVILAVKVS